MKKYLDDLKKMLERWSLTQRRRTACVVYIVYQKCQDIEDKGDREYIKVKKIQKGQKRLQAGIVSAGKQKQIKHTTKQDIPRQMKVMLLKLNVVFSMLTCVPMSSKLK